MKPGRFLRWHQARVLHAQIQAHLARGGSVMVATCTRATTYGPGHAGWFRCGRNGVYVRRGQQWDCINYCAIRFY